MTATLCRHNRGTRAGLGGGRPGAGLGGGRPGGAAGAVGREGAGRPPSQALFPLCPTGGAWPGHWDFLDSPRVTTGQDSLKVQFLGPQCWLTL